jgi:hypothetical protein
MGKQVQLKQNLILGSEFFRIDDVVDEDIIPERLRGPEMSKPPGPPRESDYEEFPLDDLGEPEEPPEPPPPPRKR